jgi:flavin-dependent dehydrogenase
VVVLGAGPSGSAAATALARESLAVLIADEQESCAFKVGESLPGIASTVIARAGFPGVLRKVSQIKCSGNRSSWGSSEIHLRPGLLNPYGGGVHLDRAQFDGELLRESIASGAQLLTGARFQRAAKSGRGWTLFLRCAAELHTVECDSVIDCTGRRACFARTQAAKRIVIDKQVAIVSVLSGESVADDDLTTTIETAREGWWYSARIPNGRRVVVFFTDGDLLPHLRARSRDGFASLMRQSVHVREFPAAGYSVERSPAVVLAETSYLINPAGGRWCAAGDAAAALDPLASAGIIDAIKCGSAAARVVLSEFKNVEDYSRVVVDQAKANIETRRSYYLMEVRWPREPFWARRHDHL